MLTGPFAGVQGSASPHNTKIGTLILGTITSGRGPMRESKQHKE